MDREREVGQVKCNLCHANYTVKINPLSEPIDVYRYLLDGRGVPETERGHVALNQVVCFHTAELNLSLISSLNAAVNGLTHARLKMQREDYSSIFCVLNFCIPRPPQPGHEAAELAIGR